MILADVFFASNYSRECEFSTNILDDPVVIQFAASNGVDLANAAEMAAPYVSGIDINCGCPQKWAIQEKIGSHLMSDPETVRDMIRMTKARVNVPCSIKIRIHKNLRSVLGTNRVACSYQSGVRECSVANSPKTNLLLSHNHHFIGKRKSLSRERYL